MDLGFKADPDQVGLLAPEDRQDLLAELVPLELQALEDPLDFLVRKAQLDLQASEAVCYYHRNRDVLLLNSLATHDGVQKTNV